MQLLTDKHFLILRDLERGDPISGTRSDLIPLERAGYMRILHDTGWTWYEVTEAGREVLNRQQVRVLH